MALNVLNKNFLAVLSRIGIDVKQFPDKTFDGLFDNVPEETNYFFNWFIENISTDNALMQWEQAVYFELQGTESIPTDEEINFLLSSGSSPGYEELMSLDLNYVNNYLSPDLEDLKKNFEELSRVLEDLQTSYSDVKRKQNSVKEKINAKNKLLNILKKDCQKTASSFGQTIDQVKIFLLKEPCFRLDLDLFIDLMKEEENILSDVKISKLLENGSFSNAKLDILPNLKKDLTCVEISTVLSEGLNREKKVRIDFLLELTQKKASQKNVNSNFIQSYLVNNEGAEVKILEDIKNLESELFEKMKMVSECEVQSIADDYFLNKLDLNKSYIAKITDCKSYMKYNWKINSCLLHILIRCIRAMENTLNMKKEVYSNLNEYETNFSNGLTNLELRRQRFKEVSAQLNQHPFLLGLKDIITLQENPEDNEETLKNIMETVLYANDDSNFIPHEFRSGLQSSVKTFFHNTLCGPTNELLFVPIELLIKFQEYEERERNLSQVVKRLASKYVGAKETISRSDRKKLLLWIDFLTNSQALAATSNESPPS